MSADTKIAIEKQGADLLLSWSGGFPPYLLQRCDALGLAWVTQGNPTMQTNRVVANIGDQGYFRVQQAVMLLDATLTETNTQLHWTVPDL